MGVATTSIDNYHQHKRSGKLGAQEQHIMQFFWLHNGADWTRSEIAQFLRIRLSSVCGRVNRLIEIGELDEAGTRSCTVTGKTVVNAPCPSLSDFNARGRILEQVGQRCHLSRNRVLALDQRVDAFPLGIC